MAKDDAMKTLKTIAVIAGFIVMIVGWSLTYAQNKGELGDRVLVVESEMSHIKDDVTDIKDDTKEIRLEQKRLSDTLIRIETKIK